MSTSWIIRGADCTTHVKTKGGGSTVKALHSERPSNGVKACRGERQGKGPQQLLHLRTLSPPSLQGLHEASAVRDGSTWLWPLEVAGTIGDEENHEGKGEHFSMQVLSPPAPLETWATTQMPFPMGPASPA